jgi:regulator of nucleoside diphosphate kinase
MDKLPAIIISRLDQQRLEAVLESADPAHYPGLEGLEREIGRATVVEPDQMPPDVVTMNSTIRFAEVASGHEFELTLVYPRDAGKPGTVSVLAPVGSALIGLSVGQSIEWPGPGGRPLDLRVLDVVRQPEAMGELHR